MTLILFFSNSFSNHLFKSLLFHHYVVVNALVATSCNIVTMLDAANNTTAPTTNGIKVFFISALSLAAESIYFINAYVSIISAIPEPV